MDDVVKAGFDKVPTAQLCSQWQLAANCAQSTVSPNNVLCPWLGRHPLQAKMVAEAMRQRGMAMNFFGLDLQETVRKKAMIGFCWQKNPFSPQQNENNRKSVMDLIFF